MQTRPSAITNRSTRCSYGLAYSSLISIGKLCDAGCTTTFDEHKVLIHKGNNTLLQGTRDLWTGLWRFSLTNTPATQETTKKIQQQINSATKICHLQINSAWDFTTIPALIKFLHAMAFSPPSNQHGCKPSKKVSFNPGQASLLRGSPNIFHTQKPLWKDTWIKLGRTSAQSNHVPINRNYKWNKSTNPNRNPTMPACNCYLQPSRKLEKYAPIKPDNFHSHPVGATNISLSYMTTTQTPF